MDIHVSYYIEKTEELVMQKKNRHSVSKITLSVLLSLIMVLGNFALFSAVLTVNAADSTPYNVTVTWNVVNTKDTYDGNRMI